jgi:hypothetical protein
VSVGLSLSACANDSSELEDAGPTGFRSLDDNLELHWTFEDHVGTQITDLSGNGRHGTLLGGSFVSSPNGEAASLDGVDDYISLTHLGLRAPSLYGGVNGDFTISARVRVADVNKLNALCTGCGPFSVMFVGTATYPATVLSAVFNQTTGGLLWPTSSAVLTDDEWREVTMVVDGGVAARYYFDCELDTQLQNSNIGLKDYNFSAVGLGSSAERWYGGEIDELRVWSRALSEQELAELCPVEPPPPPLEQGLQLHWTFEDRVGSQVTDVSGNARHGTLQGGGSFVSSPNGEAVSLDGVNDYLSVTHLGLRAPSLYGGVDGDFTISARVRVEDVNKLNALCTGCGPFSAMFVGTPAYGPTVLSAVFNQQTGGSLWPMSSAALTDDTWSEVTMVVEGGVAARYYLDCGLDTQLQNSNIGLKDYNFSAVGLGSSADRWYGGEIDELRVWNRALPEAELELLCECLGPIHVDIDAPNGGDGESWATAFNDLQAAIDAGEACDSPEIWVAEGTYAPDPNVSVATITEAVSIYGGFAGTEVALAQRDVNAHPVQLGGPGWQSRVVKINETAVTAATVVRLDGFTISGSEAGAIEVGGWQQVIPGVFFHNLVITDNSASQGAGILATGSLILELVNSHFEGNIAASGGAAVHLGLGADAHVDNSTFVDNESPNSAIHSPNGDFSDSSNLYISNSTMSGNIGGAIYTRAIVATNTEFNNNTGVRGAAIYVRKAGLEVHDCSFTGNHADYGGAIYLYEFTDSSQIYEIYDSSFSGNTARLGGALYFDGNAGEFNPDELRIESCEFNNNGSTNGGGGALWLSHGEGEKVTLDGTSFVGNTATGGGGGALYIDEGQVAIEGSTFLDNSAPYGGAMQVGTGTAELTVSDSRFIGNQALVSTGGALRTTAPVASVTNTEFVGNASVSHGGGVWGRATLVATTFANNVAGGVGNGLFAPAGAWMTIRNVVAWPDNLIASSIALDHSCIPLVTATHTNDGTLFIAADPFAPDDLDLDGLTEFYLAPGSACVDIGGTVGEFDWTVMTTQASQCTDFTPVDAGVHYTPLFAAGPC